MIDIDQAVRLVRNPLITQKPMLHKCEDGWHWAPPPLRDYDLWHVMAGRGSLELNGEKAGLHAGVCYLFRPGDTPCASQEIRENLFVFSVHFNLPGDPSGIARRTQVHDSGGFGYLARCCVENWSKPRLGEALGRVCLQHMLILLLETQGSRAWDPVEKQILEICSAIDSDPAGGWAVETLARRARLSRSQFTRRFAAATGMSPHRYLIRARIARARQMLGESGMSIGQIADALGYADVYFFSRQFKHHTGIAPSRARKNAAARPA
ncbi:MAG: AraC family transcriptional regulator [Opitutaceae bacterium]|nr:AraC family transcriptional regulator [Opitutaceae bacterium]